MRIRTGAVLLIVQMILVVLPAGARELRAPIDVDASFLRSHTVDGALALDWEGSDLLLEPGREALPIQRLQFVLGAGETITSVALEGGRAVRVGDAATLRRVDALLGEDGRPADVTSSFGAAELARAATYPPVEARVLGTSYRHGRTLVTVEVFPLRIDAEGALWLREGARVVAQVGIAERAPTLVVRERDSGRWAADEARALRADVANPQDVSPLNVTLAPEDAPPASATTGPTLSSAPVRHLILTTAAMAPAFQRLADHRTALGLPSIVVTLDQVLATTRQGADLSETLRNYVIDAYTKWGVDYVLLGGDTESLPTRYVRSTFYPAGSYTDIPTDHYFAGLDGNWNEDGDELFGEPFRSSIDPGDFPDYAPEIAVGRAPANTLVEANAFVDKVLAYEIPATNTWQNRLAIASEVLFPLGWQEPDPVQYDGAVPSEDLINTYLQPCADPDWSVTRYYERPYAYPGTQQASVQNVVSALNSGTYGVFHHIGHGFYFTMSVGQGSLSPAEVDGLSNGPNYFMLYSLNCSSSAFDFNCLNERFVRDADGGAVVSIGSSRSAFPSGSEPLQEAFYQTWHCGGFERVGDIVAETRTQFAGAAQVLGVTQWTQLIYTLLGDPATLLWSQKPRIATAFGPANVALGATNVTISVAEVPLGAVEGVTVTLSKGAEDYATGVTGANGTVTLPFTPETTGSVTVWISGGGVKPASISIPVGDPNVGVPAVQSFALSDDAIGASDGNGNGCAEGGETIELQPLLRNGSATAFAGGLAQLSTSDPYVTVIDGTVTIPALPGGASVLASESFVLSIDPSAPDGHAVALSIMLDTGGVFDSTDRETLVLGAPQIEVTSVRFVDSGTGNGNGVPETGESFDVVVQLKNYGSGATGTVVGTLAPVAGAVTVLDASTQWPDAASVLDAVDNLGDVARMRLDGSAVGVVMALTLTDGAGRMSVHEFDLVAPGTVGNLRLVAAGPSALQIAWDRPSLADLLGYRVYRTAAGVPGEILASDDVILDVATFADDGLDALTVFTYRVAVVDSGGVEGPKSSSFSASTTPPELECFPLPMGLETSSALAIGQIDTDAALDMVIGTEFVYAIDGECNEQLDGDGDAQTFGPLNADEGRYGPNAILLAELDGEPGQEIVTVERDTKRVFVYDASGQPLPGWPRTLANWAWSSPVAGDVDGDGQLEIVVNDLSGYTYAFNVDGTEVADGDANPATYGVIAPRRVSNGVFESFGRTTPAVLDVDGDGRDELLFGSKFQSGSAPDYFYALNADGTGGNAPGWPKQLLPQSGFLASPSVGDIDGDGKLEIIAPCENDSLYVWEPDGKRQPSFPIRLRNDGINVDSLTPSPALGDFDGDGRPEIVAVAVYRELVGGKNVWRSYVHVIDENGTTLPGWPKIAEDLSESSPVVGDIDGDGGLDVVYGIGGTEADDYLYAWNTTGQNVRGFPIPIAGFVRATPTLTDFDRNGTLDIALASWDRLIHVWDTGATYDPTKVPWPTFRGNVNRTGVLGEHVVTDTGPSLPSARVATIASVVPNPFNPQTVVRFELPSGVARARLAVYDVQGRLVRVLVDRAVAAGRHDVRWDGTDASGATVATGVYFAVLDVDGARASARKLTLLK